MQTAPENVPDAQCVAAVLAGNRSAFAELSRRHERAVRALAQGILRDEHAAQDVAQEAFLAAYRKLGSLRDGARFGPWVLRITRRIALRAARRRARTVGRGRDDGNGAPLEAAAGVPAPALPPPLLDEQEQALLEAVARLPPGERAVVLLRHFEGHSLPHVAALLGRPVGTVTKQLSRAHRRLRGMLQEFSP